MLPWQRPDPPDRLRTLRETSLPKLVRDDLLDAILQGRLQPGDRINEPDVCQRLQVSRVPVREALRELESSGLVVSRKHAGVFVRQIEAGEVRELYELRSVLDGHVGARVAALPAAERKVLAQALQASIARMHEACARQEVPRYYAENLNFHWLILSATGNQTLCATYQSHIQRLHLARLQTLSQDVGMQRSIAEHERIASAIAQGDAALAGQLLTDHVNGAHQRLVHRPPISPTSKETSHEKT